MLRGLLNHADATAACLPSRTERSQAPKAKSKHNETTHASSSSQIELLIAKPMPAKCKATFKIWFQQITTWSTWLHDSRKWSRHVETIRTASAVDSMPSLQAVKHNAINLRLLCLAPESVGNTELQWIWKNKLQTRVIQQIGFGFDGFQDILLDCSDCRFGTQPETSFSKKQCLMLMC